MQVVLTSIIVKRYLRLLIQTSEANSIILIKHRLVKPNNYVLILWVDLLKMCGFFREDYGVVVKLDEAQSIERRKPLLVQIKFIMLFLIINKW